MVDNNLKIPLSKPYLGNEELEVICKVMESKAIASGQVVRTLEDGLASKFQRKYCVVVNSGHALYI